MTESNENDKPDCTVDDTLTKPGQRTGGITGRGWQKGQSGNPAGRPRSASIIDTLRLVLDEPLDATDVDSPTKRIAVCRKVVELALEGNVKAIEALLKHAEPLRLRQQIKARTMNVLQIGDGTHDDLHEEVAAILTKVIADQRVGLLGATNGE